MSNTTPINSGNPTKRLSVACLGPLLLLAQGACSPPESVTASNLTSSNVFPKANSKAVTPSAITDAKDSHSTGAPAPVPPSDAIQTASRVIAKHDRTNADGKRACEIDFVYAGREQEDVFWHEPCDKVIAKMVKQNDLETSGRWNRLNSFQQKLVGEMPGGQVLYIEGSFSASVYPVDETGTSIEVAVAD